MMTAIHILLNSYIGLYDFLELPEGLWLRTIMKRVENMKTEQPYLPFSDLKGPNFEKSEDDCSFRASYRAQNVILSFYRTAIIL